VDSDKALCANWTTAKVIFDRPAEILLAMGDWATVNFHPCFKFNLWKIDIL
jgi:hypothetical protein